MLDPTDRRTATIIWGALVAGVSMFLAIAIALPEVAGTGDPGLANALFPVSGALSVATVAASWLWAVRMRPAPLPGGAPRVGADLARTRLIVASALCEGSALFATVAFLVTRDERTLIPFVLSFGSLLSHFPGERQWARLAQSAPDPARTNRLMRG